MKYLERYIEKAVKADLERKMVFIAGPRQAGKTTLAKRILAENGEDITTRYLNWDAGEDREMILREQFPAGPGYLVLDEIHKYSNWRQVVKGLFDKRGRELKILVTGSARLDYYRKGGDSLQGRYHFYRLLPLTLKELSGRKEGLDHLLAFSGFPEPFSLSSEKETRRWSREYRTRLIHEDLRDLEHVLDVSKLEQIALRLPDLAGSPLSINSLREDVNVSHQTVSRWVNILENLYLLFRLPPFGAPKIRAVKKEAKHYHYDWTLISDPGIRFENMMAVHLLQWAYFQQDAEGRDVELRYFRDIDRREVDFVIMEDGKPRRFIEAKTSFRHVHPGLKYLKVRFPGAEAVQVTREDTRDLVTKEGIRLTSAHAFLEELI